MFRTTYASGPRTPGAPAHNVSASSSAWHTPRHVGPVARAAGPVAPPIATPEPFFDEDDTRHHPTRHSIAPHSSSSAAPALQTPSMDFGDDDGDRATRSGTGPSPALATPAMPIATPAMDDGFGDVEDDVAARGPGSHKAVLRCPSMASEVSSAPVPRRLSVGSSTAAASSAHAAAPSHNAAVARHLARMAATAAGAPSTPAVPSGIEEADPCASAALASKASSVTHSEQLSAAPAAFSRTASGISQRTGTVRNYDPTPCMSSVAQTPVPEEAEASAPLEPPQVRSAYQSRPHSRSMQAQRDSAVPSRVQSSVSLRSRARQRTPTPSDSRRSPAAASPLVPVASSQVDGSVMDDDVRSSQAETPLPNDRAADQEAVRISTHGDASRPSPMSSPPTRKADLGMPLTAGLL